MVQEIAAETSQQKTEPKPKKRLATAGNKAQKRTAPETRLGEAFLQGDGGGGSVPLDPGLRTGAPYLTTFQRAVGGGGANSVPMWRNKKTRACKDKRGPYSPGLGGKRSSAGLVATWRLARSRSGDPDPPGDALPPSSTTTKGCRLLLASPSQLRLRPEPLVYTTRCISHRGGINVKGI